MISFDASERNYCIVARQKTSTPLQALILLNDPQYVEASRVLSEHLVKTHRESQDARWDELFRRLISRLPTDRERAVVDRLYHEQLTYFQQDQSAVDEFLKVGSRPADRTLDQTKVAAVAVVVQTIIAYDETIMLR